MNRRFQRKDTRFSKDGLWVSSRLCVSRVNFEFARSWAQFHQLADPTGTAEDQIEGYVGRVLEEHLTQMGWEPPDEVKALYEAVRRQTREWPQTQGELPF